MKKKAESKTMMKSVFAILVITCAISKSRAQIGGVTAAGQYYVCVPAGFCNNGGTGTIPGGTGIDPRIITPGQQCANGQIPCYTQGTASQCSNRFINASIVDGNTIASNNPWLAYIQNSTFPIYAGAGVLIDNYHILTAAHKVAGDIGNPTAVRVIMGAFDANNQTRVASRIIIHPQFNNATLKNDIAIIQVSQPFSLSQANINSACLPATGTSAAAYINQTCLVAGWGETSYRQNNQPVNPLKQVNVNVVSYETCRASFSNATLLGTNVDTYLDVNYAEICAGGALQKDACTFDGGAPLMCPSAARGTITGLVIWGKGCGRQGVYGVYVSVPYYRGWIDTTLTSLNAGAA